MKFLKKNLVTLIVTVLAVLAVCLFFADCVKVDGLGDDGFSGFQVMFGYSEDTILGSLQVLEFSFGAFIALLLLVVGVVLLWLDFVPLNNLLSAVLLLVAGIFVFLFPQTIGAGDSKEVLDYVGTPVLYVNGVLLILSAILAAAKEFITKLIK